MEALKVQILILLTIELLLKKKKIVYQVPKKS